MQDEGIVQTQLLVIQLSLLWCLCWETNICGEGQEQLVPPLAFGNCQEEYPESHVFLSSEHNTPLHKQCLQIFIASPRTSSGNQCVFGLFLLPTHS